jgi:hypothetical protein
MLAVEISSEYMSCQIYVQIIIIDMCSGFRESCVTLLLAS